jgi:lipid-A-disaccharide synthase
MAWARPVLQALAEDGRAWRVYLVFWPRLFLSGREAAAAAQLTGVLRALSPVQSLLLLARALKTPDPDTRSPAVVLHLGGPACLSLRLGRLQGAPVLAYTERPTTLPPGFAAAYCTAPPDSRQCASARPIGNLLVDSVSELKELRSRRRSGAGGQPIVGLLPGSRLLQLRQYLPRIEPVAQAVLRQRPQARFVIARSPLVSERMLARAARQGGGCWLETAGGALALRARCGLRIPVLDRDEVLSLARVLVCTPGTSTGEAAALGIPHLVVAPFEGSLSLYGGIPGLIERSPLLGAALKRLALRSLAGDMQYYAQANALAGREIVPELQGPVDVQRVADNLAALLDDAPCCQRMSEELEGTMGPPGAARRLAAELAAHLQPGARSIQGFDSAYRT